MIASWLAACVALAAAGAFTVARAQSTLAVIAGVAYDSVAQRPIAGAMIQLVPTATLHSARTVTSDVAGAFQFDSVADGDYVLGLLDERTNALPLPPSLTSLRVSPGRRHTVVLGIPGAGATRQQLCGDLATTDSAVIAIRVLTATGRPLTSAVIRTRWRELTLRSGRMVIAMAGRDATTDVAGVATFCNVPAATELELTAVAGPRSAQLTLDSTQAGGVWMRAVYIPSEELAGDTTWRARSAMAGTVRDQASRPIGSARVLRTSDSLEVRTDSLGRFRFADMPWGSAQFRVRALGFQPALVLADHLPQTDDTTNIVLERSTTLTAVRVTALRSFAGFFERQGQGRGQFVGESEIRRRDPMFVGDLVDRLPGVVVSNTRGFGRRIAFRTPRGSCTPTIFVDGVDRGIRMVDLDAMIASSDIRALEVYQREEDVPPEFNTPAGCGALIVWRRTVSSP